MPERDAKLFEVLIGQMREYRDIDVVYSKTLCVLRHAELFEPVRDLLHREASPYSPRGLAALWTRAIKKTTLREYISRLILMLNSRCNNLKPPCPSWHDRKCSCASRRCPFCLGEFRFAAVMLGRVRADRAGRSVQSISLRLPHDLSADIRQPGQHTAVRRRGPRRRSTTAFLPARRNS